MGMDLLSLARLLQLLCFPRFQKETPPNPQGSPMASRAARASGSTRDLKSDRPKSQAQISHSLAV